MLTPELGTFDPEALPTRAGRRAAKRVCQLPYNPRRPVAPGGRLFPHLPGGGWPAELREVRPLQQACRGWSPRAGSRLESSALPCSSLTSREPVDCFILCFLSCFPLKAGRQKSARRLPARGGWPDRPAHLPARRRPRMEAWRGLLFCLTLLCVLLRVRGKGGLAPGERRAGLCISICLLKKINTPSPTTSSQETAVNRQSVEKKDRFRCDGGR